MTCDECEAITVHGCPPESRTRGNPTCIYCGARQIQRVQRVLRIERHAIAERCRLTLGIWLKHGHDETKLRELAKKQEWAVQPKKGVRG